MPINLCVLRQNKPCTLSSISALKGKRQGQISPKSNDHFYRGHHSTLFYQNTPLIVRTHTHTHGRKPIKTIRCFAVSLTRGVITDNAANEDEVTPAALADPQGAWPQTSDELFVLRKTDYTTNWPTLRVVIMQKGVHLQRASPLTPWPGALPLDPAGGSAFWPQL